MALMKKVSQHLRGLARIVKEDGLINTTDLLVATAATVVLAAGVGGAALSTLNDAKYGKAQPDAQAITGAISAFYKDTGKWPGQAEQAAESADAAPTYFLVTTTTGTLPTALSGTVSVTAATCENNSLEGFVGRTIVAGTLASATKLDINDFLVRKPDPAKYQNWKGPYLQADIRTDPWDRAWVLNLQPLYCSEKITGGTGANATTGGKLGYAWLLSGGTNRTVSTTSVSANLDSTGDDAGVNMGKLLTRGTGGADQ